MEKSITYTTSNTYDTLNSYSEKTKNVWLVFHGIGYLSRFFIRHFNQLNADDNYIICPQAPSKYYKDSSYKKVGSSWLTKENTLRETNNVLNYIDSIMDHENINFNTTNFIVLGYSQGVSVATRWLAMRKYYCDRLILVSGVFPKELAPKDFSHLNNTKIYHTVGIADEIFDPINVKKQEKKLLEYFPEITFLNHKGGHILETGLLKKYLQ